MIASSIRIFQLAAASWRFRKTAIILSIASVTIAIILFVVVEKIRKGSQLTFHAAIGQTDLIVGARGNDLQLVLATIFQTGHLANGISYQTYNRFKEHKAVRWSIPLSYGDSHKGFRVVATDTNYLKFWRGPSQMPLSFLTGKGSLALWRAVIGFDVAQKLKYQIGDRIYLNHGVSQEAVIGHGELSFLIEGVLNKTHDSTDRSILISLAGQELIHRGWQDGLPPQETPAIKDLEKMIQPHQHGQEKISAFYLRLKNKGSILSLQRQIAEFEKEPLTAAIPGIALQRLWDVLGVVEKSLFYISLSVIIAGFLSLLVTFFSNQQQRRREIAILRAVAARPKHIVLLFIAESVLMIVIALTCGYLLAISGLWLVSEILAEQVSIYLPLSTFSKFEILFICCLLFGSALISVVPAVLAYRRSVHDGLLQ